MTNRPVQSTPSVRSRLLAQLRGWFSPEGSLSLMLPPGLALPAETGTDLLEILRERG